MDKQAAVPPSLPRPGPTVSYWQDPPADIADRRSTSDLPKSADVVIIGSGISGACIAHNLLEKDASLKIVMLEARQACSGATGRNGGHTKGASYRSFLDNKESLGLEEAIKIARLEYDNIKAVHEFSRQNNIDCDLFSGDTVDIIYDEASWEQAHEAVETMRDAMPNDLDTVANYTFYSYEEAREKFHVQGEKFAGAVLYEAGSLSAYKLVIGVLKLGLAKGLNLQTNTPVLDLNYAENEWLVKTDRGDIGTAKVVLATNGYTGRIYDKLRGAIVPLRGQITAHRPGQNMPEGGLETTYSFIYANGYEYMIPRPRGSRFEGDIVIGGGLVHAAEEGLYEFGNCDDTTLNPEISKYLTATTPSYFGESWGEDQGDGRIRKEWSGIMGYSPDGFPFVGRVPGEHIGLWISASFQGHGMVLCFMCARALAIMMTGEEAELDSWFPSVFKITEERMHKKFVGRLHTKSAKDLEFKAQG